MTRRNVCPICGEQVPVDDGAQHMREAHPASDSLTEEQAATFRRLVFAAAGEITKGTPRPEEIPTHLWPGICGYLLDRRPVGGFLTSLFEGELETAAACADTTSAQALPYLIAWLEEHAPAEAVGSADRVRAWLDGWKPGPHAPW